MRAAARRFDARPMVFAVLASAGLLAFLLLPASEKAEAADHADLTWIFWGPSWEDVALKSAPARPLPLTPRAVARLARSGADASAAEPANRSAPQAFLDHLASLGVRPRVVSRLVRAVSAVLTEAQAERLRTDPGVTALVPAAIYVRPKPTVTDDDLVFAPEGVWPGPREQSLGAPAELPDPPTLRVSDYGESFRQSEQLGVPALHRLGYAGDGVMVCLLDSGFRTSHAAFRGADVVATYDFANDDSIVSHEADDPDGVGMESHGTGTWSTLGGFHAPYLIGPAYRASFLLGRTEVIRSETFIEEEHYARGLDWADSLGADVISTSLGYREGQDFFHSQDDMDGRTAFASIAAARLAARGIVLATAMGNEGRRGMPVSLVAPADAESVLAVGAVDTLGNLAPFSSRGPTADGRIKPEVCADGGGVFCAARNSDQTYDRNDGTSFATPLIGGLAALVRQVRPEWTPPRVIRALKRAGSQADNPDNNRGWGVPDALIAIDADTTADLRVEAVRWSDLRPGLPGDFPDSTASPGDSGIVILALHNRGPQASPPAWVSVIGLAGQAIASADSVRLAGIPAGGSAYPAGGLAVGLAAVQPVYAPATLLVRIAGDNGAVYYRRAPLRLRPAQVVAQAYPNPVRSGEELTFDLTFPESGTIDVRVYNVAGRLVAEPFRDFAVQARQSLRFRPAAHLRSGLYFLRIDGGRRTETRRFLLLR